MCGEGQSPAGSRSAGASTLNGKRVPMAAPSTSPPATTTSDAESPARWATMPITALPIALPPWKTTR